MTIDELKRKKRELALTNEELAERSGVPLGTVQKIMSGVTKAPRRETLEALMRVLFPVTYAPLENDALAVREAQAAYQVNPEQKEKKKKKQGEYTVEDYLALPDERRVELIDGVFYDMAAPTFVHQSVLISIGTQLDRQMKDCPHRCFLSVAPTDVQLDCDNRTMVQPDILVVCDRGKITAPRVFGAPDFAIEILSPSTKRKDLFIKGEKYLNAGVREYWVVDPENRQIIQYDFMNNALIRLYSFDDIVPVLISEGKCSVDFKMISERLAELNF